LYLSLDDFQQRHILFEWDCRVINIVLFDLR
jgi:hypothetical protein